MAYVVRSSDEAIQVAKAIAEVAYGKEQADRITPALLHNGQATVEWTAPDPQERSNLLVITQRSKNKQFVIFEAPAISNTNLAHQCSERLGRPELAYGVAARLRYGRPGDATQVRNHLPGVQSLASVEFQQAAAAEFVGRLPNLLEILNQSGNSSAPDFPYPTVQMSLAEQIAAALDEAGIAIDVNVNADLDLQGRATGAAISDAWSSAVDESTIQSQILSAVCSAIDRFATEGNQFRSFRHTEVVRYKARGSQARAAIEFTHASSIDEYGRVVVSDDGICAEVRMSAEPGLNRSDRDASETQKDVFNALSFCSGLSGEHLRSRALELPESRPDARYVEAQFNTFGAKFNALVKDYGSPEMEIE